MGLIEGFLKDELFIDFGAGVINGSDQLYLSHPCRFATVTFQLMDTAGLSQIADRMRKELGLKPMHPMDEYTDAMCDQDGWYDFFVDLVDWSDTKVGMCIEFMVVSEDAQDNEEFYTIDLDEAEQRAVFNRLDEQCREYLGEGCLELLEESRKEMEEDEV